MRPGVALAVAVAAAAIACGRVDQRLEIELRAPAVGATITEEETTTQVTTLITGQRRTVLTDRERKLSVETVLAVAGGAASRIEVEYQALERSQAVDGAAPDPTPSALVGKRYLVWRDGDVVHAAAVDGAHLTEAELEEVVEENRELGEVPRLARLVGSRPWKRGERVVLDAAGLAAMARSRDTTTIEARAGAVTWTTLEQAIATFEVEMLLVQDDAQKSIESELRSTVRVDLHHDLPVEIVATGTTRGSMKAGPLAGVTIEGTIDGRSTFHLD